MTNTIEYIDTSEMQMLPLLLIELYYINKIPFKSLEYITFLYILRTNSFFDNHKHNAMQFSCCKIYPKTKRTMICFSSKVQNRRN